MKTKKNRNEKRIDDLIENIEDVSYRSNGRDTIWTGKIQGDLKIPCPVEKSKKLLSTYLGSETFTKESGFPEEIVEYLELWEKTVSPFRDLIIDGQTLLTIRKGNYQIGALIKPWQKNPKIASVVIYKRRIANVIPANRRESSRHQYFIEKYKRSPKKKSIKIFLAGHKKSKRKVPFVNRYSKREIRRIAISLVGMLLAAAMALAQFGLIN